MEEQEKDQVRLGRPPGLTPINFDSLNRVEKMDVGPEALAGQAMRPEDPKELHWSYITIMDNMIAHPEWTQEQLGEAVGLTKTRVCQVVNTPLFELAFRERRKKHSSQVSERIIAATLDAIAFEHGIVNGTVKDARGVETEVSDLAMRLASAKDILAQGHAKAVEKQARLTADLPPEAIENLVRVFREVGE